MDFNDCRKWHGEKIRRDEKLNLKNRWDENEKGKKLGYDTHNDRNWKKKKKLLYTWFKIDENKMVQSKLNT